MVEAQPKLQAKTDSQLWIHVARLMSETGALTAPEVFIDRETGRVYSIQDGKTWRIDQNSKIDE